MIAHIGPKRDILIKAHPEMALKRSLKEDYSGCKKVCNALPLQCPNRGLTTPNKGPLKAFINDDFHQIIINK